MTYADQEAEGPRLIAERDEWKARAEKAEAAHARDAAKDAVAVYRGNKRAERFAKYALRYRRLLAEERVSHIKFIWKITCKQVDLEAECDRLRALLREVPCRHRRGCGFWRSDDYVCTCGLDAWRDRVRAELEDKK